MKNSFVEIREFLDNNNIGCKSYHFKILEEMDLKDDKTISTFREILDRYEDSPNEYSEEIMTYLRQRRGLNKYDTSEDEEINKMDKSEAFEDVLSWNNLVGGWGNTIKEWVKEIYKIDLDNYEEKR